LSKFLRDAATTITSRGVSLVAGLGAGIVTARLLGPDGRGFYYLATTWAALGVQFGSMGGAAGVIWLRRHHGTSTEDLLGTSVFQAIAAGSIATAGILIGAAALGIVGAKDYSTWAAVVLLAIGGVFLQLASSLLLADGHSNRYNVVQVLNSTINGACVATAAWMFARPTPVIYAAALASVAAAAVAGTLASGRTPARWRVNFGAIRLVGGYSTRVFATSLAAFVAQRVSVIVLAMSTGADQVGFYSVAAQICDALLAVPASVAALLFPTLVSRGSTDWSRARRTLLWTTAVVAAVALVIGLAAPALLNALFGDRFDAAAVATRHLLPSIVILAASTMLSQFIAAAGAPFTAAVPWICAVAVGAVWCLVAAPLSGAQGAADSQTAANACALAGLWVVSRRVRRSVATEAPKPVNP
jgi:O-antigen/teichoic acid export membrane protein